MLPRFRLGPLWLVLPVMIAIGAGGGYLAAGFWSPGAHPPSVTGAAEHDHGANPPAVTGADGHDHGTATEAHDDHAAPQALASSPAADPHAGHQAAATPTADPHAGHDGGGDDAAASGGEHGAHEDSATADGPVSRPRTAVLSGFAAVNLAILIAAAVLRRRSPARNRRARPPTAPAV